MKINLNVNEIRKFLVSVIGLAGIALSQGLIEGTAAKWVSVGIGVATALGVYVVPNDAPASPVVKDVETVVKDVEQAVEKPKTETPEGGTSAPGPSGPPL